MTKIDRDFKKSKTVGLSQGYAGFLESPLIEGRTEKQKNAVIEKVTQALHEAIGVPRENVRILIQDISKTEWALAE